MSKFKHSSWNMKQYLQENVYRFDFFFKSHIFGAKALSLH